jgi:hypothetical protein
LLSLIRHVRESSMPGRTDKEQKTIDEVRLQLGEPLADFLLAGCGEGEQVNRRAYVVTARFGLQDAHRRYVEMRADAHVGLPRWREMHVFAAVLHSLIESESSSYVAGMRYAQVLETLGWEDTPEGRARIERALDKYSRLTFVEVRSHHRVGAPAEEVFFVTRLRPVTEYQSRGRVMDGTVDEDASFRLEFIEVFRTWLMSRGFFGTEWLGLYEVKPAEWDSTITGASEALKHISGEGGES